MEKMKMDHYLVYVTATSKSEAITLGQSAVESRNAACANVLGESTSIFRWEGEIQTNSETILILKTTSDKLASLIDKLKKIHSYECPCVLAINIKKGNPDFLDWITHEVQ